MKSYFWVTDNKVIAVQFLNDVVYQVVVDEINNNIEDEKLDPETTHFISFNEGYALKGYTEKLDEWGIKYEILKEENFEYENNVVTKIEPNSCNIDKNTVVKLTVSDNTYDMNVIADTGYLINLAGLNTEKYISKYNEDGTEVFSEIQLLIKVNGNDLFNGKTEARWGINNAKGLGMIRGKATSNYNIEITIEGIKIKEKINYAIIGDKNNKSMYIYAGGDIGAG